MYFKGILIKTKKNDTIEKIVFLNEKCRWKKTLFRTLGAISNLSKIITHC